MLFALLQLSMLIAVVPSKCWVWTLQRSRRTRLDGAIPARFEVAGVICDGGRGKGRGEEANFLSIDGERVGVQCLVDLLPGTEAGGWARRGGLTGAGGGGKQAREEVEQ